MLGKWSSVALLGLTLTVLLAGCAGEPPKKAADEQVNFDDLDLEASETTGLIRGVVFDEGVRPLSGVLVAALGATERNLTMVTGEDGAFGFDGLDPGTYFITASRPGYTQQQASTDVIAGVAAPEVVKILLTADPASGPFIESQHLDGYITCSVRPMFIGLQCGVTSQDVVNARYELDKTPEWIQSEMRWKSTQAFGDELSLAIRCLTNSERCPAGQLTIARSEGKSPQIARINRSHAELWALGTGDPLQLSIFAFGRSDLDVYNETTVDNAQRPATGKPCLDWMGTLFPAGTCIRATGPGFIINQKVDVYTHLFYGFVPDPAWTFGANGLPPVPQ